MSGAADPRIVLASGGTGGHMFPAAALAHALTARGHAPALLCDARGAAWGGMPKDVAVHQVPSASPSGSPGQRARALWTLFRGTRRARRLLAELAADAVVGFGGYASVPAVTAALMSKRPIVLHEQNAVLGRANRLWAKRAAAIATAFDELAGLPAGGALRGRVTVTGNPVRAAIAAVGERPYTPPEAAGKLRVLVLGGSQGARIFSDVVPVAMARLAAEQRARIDIAQQCRPEDLDRVKAAYAGIGMRPVLATFFDDVPERLAVAHLVVSRSGASTVAELTAAGRPAILVPYKYAMDDHQTYNARALAHGGVAWTIAHDDFTPAALAERLEALLTGPEALAEAAAKAKAMGHADAAERLADLVLAVIRDRGQT